MKTAVVKAAPAPSLSAHSIDLQNAREVALALLTDIRKGEALLEHGQRILNDRRFRLGQLLANVRKTFPASGRNAAGWGLFCKEIGICLQTAQRYIETAQQVAAKPELAEARSWQELYEELGLHKAGWDRFVSPPHAVEDALPVVILDDTEDDKHEGRGGRPVLPEHERRTELVMVRLNDKELRRMHRLSGIMQLNRYADILREGLLALEERETAKLKSIA